MPRTKVVKKIPAKRTAQEKKRIDKMLVLAKDALTKHTDGTIVFIGSVKEVKSKGKSGTAFDGLCHVHGVPRHVLAQIVADSFHLDPMEIALSQILNK